MKKSSTFLFIFFFIISSFNLEARRGASFGGLSRSSSWGSSLRNSRSSWGSRTGSTTSKSTTTSAAQSATRTNRSGSTYYTTARKNNTVFNDRSQAASAFENKYRSQYSNNFSKEPQQRPSYIPNTTSVNGRNVPLFYNSTYGGYGYTNPLTGAFIAYSVFSDLAMMNLLMRQNSYYYGAAPPVLASTSFGFLGLAMWILIIFIALNVINFIRRRSQN